MHYALCFALVIRDTKSSAACEVLQALADTALYAEWGR